MYFLVFLCLDLVDFPGAPTDVIATRSIVGGLRGGGGESAIELAQLASVRHADCPGVII